MARPRERQETDVDNRLRTICEEQNLAGLEDLSSEIGVPLQRLVKWGPRNSISKEGARAIAERFQYPLGWVLTGETRVQLGMEAFSERHALLSKHARPLPSLSSGMVEVDRTEFLSLPRFDTALSAGPGSYLEESPVPLGYMLFESQWIRALTAAAPEYLSVFQVDGDSMETTLFDRDWILVDQTQRNLQRSGVYGLRVGRTIWVKRLELDLESKKVRITSDNTHYKPHLLAEEDIDLIGRVIWVVGRKL